MQKAPVVEFGRHTGLKILRLEKAVPVQVWPGAPVFPLVWHLKSLPPVFVKEKIADIKKLCICCVKESLEKHFFKKELCLQIG